MRQTCKQSFSLPQQALGWKTIKQITLPTGKKQPKVTGSLHHLAAGVKSHKLCTPSFRELILCCFEAAQEVR